MGRLLIFLSGAHPRVLNLVPTERYRFISLGGIVLTTSAIATISMTYAFSEQGISFMAALPIGILWGLTIATINRWLVASVAIRRTRRWITALPYYAISILQGPVIATPLVLGIFNNGIDAELHRMKLPLSSGLLARLHALDALSSHNMGVGAARWLLFGFFILIEALPLTVKLQSAGVYEAVLLVEAEKEMRQARIALRAREAGDLRAGEIPSKVDTDDDVDINSILLRLGPPPGYAGPPDRTRNEDGGASA